MKTDNRKNDNGDLVIAIFLSVFVQIHVLVTKDAHCFSLLNVRLDMECRQGQLIRRLFWHTEVDKQTGRQAVGDGHRRRPTAVTGVDTT